MFWGAEFCLKIGSFLFMILNFSAYGGNMAFAEIQRSWPYPLLETQADLVLCHPCL